MAKLTYEDGSQLVEACRAGATEAAEALGRALGGTFELQLDQGVEHEAYAAEGIGEPLQGPGLVLLFQWDDGAMVAMLPESSGLLPPWVREPGASEKSRLETLAQEWSLTLLPEQVEVTTTRAAYVDSLAAAVERGRPDAESGQLEITLRGGSESGPLWLVWPLRAAEAVLSDAADGGQEDRAVVGQEQQAGEGGGEDHPAADAPATAGGTADPPRGASPPRVDPLERLPPYSRSLLKVRVTVSVRLATKRQTIRQILQLGPGTIINFDKPCDEMLELRAGGCMIATGEAVKVGEKFGLRIHAMTRPDERFHSVRRPA